MNAADFTAATGKRIQNLLMPGEVVRYAARRHWLSYYRALLCLVLVLCALAIGFSLRQPEGPFLLLFSDVSRSDLGPGGASRLLCEYTAAFFLVLAGLSAVTTAVLNWTLIMVVTSRRIILRMGLIARDTTDLPLAKVDIVMVEQGVLDRITGCGTVIVRTVSEASMSFIAISHPTGMRNAVISATELTASTSSGKSA